MYSHSTLELQIVLLIPEETVSGDNSPMDLKIAQNYLFLLKTFYQTFMGKMCGLGCHEVSPQTFWAPGV